MQTTFSTAVLKTCFQIVAIGNPEVSHITVLQLQRCVQRPVCFPERLLQCFHSKSWNIWLTLNTAHGMWIRLVLYVCCRGLTLFCHVLSHVLCLGSQIADHIVHGSLVFQEKWPDHTLVQHSWAVPWHWSHAPNQEQTLRRQQRPYLVLCCCEMLDSLSCVNTVYWTVVWGSNALGH